MSPILLLALTFSVFQYTEAFCCPWVMTQNVKCQCLDGSLVHPWECCSKGTCNVFCCNCGGPCKENKTEIIAPNRFQRDTHKLDLMENGMYREQLEMYFSGIDLNSDRRIDFAEFSKYMQSRLHRPVQDQDIDEFYHHFLLMDVNGDELIQPKEFDEDLD